MTITPSNVRTELLRQSHRLLEQFIQPDFDALTVTYLDVLEHFITSPYSSLSPETVVALDSFLKNFFTVFCDETYAIPERYVYRVIQTNPVLCNLAALSSFATTDLFVSVVQKQQNNFAKLLLLVNARSRLSLDVSKLLELNARATSLWYAVFFFSAYSRVLPLVADNARRHVMAANPGLIYLPGRSLEAVFASSYIDECHDREVKEHLNRSIQSQLASCQIENRPDRRKIAILTQRWMPTSSVYKILRHFVAALKPHYHLTLVHLGDLDKELVDRSLFDEVLFVAMAGGNIDIRSIRQNDFQLAFFPDVGMSEESVLLSNLRICPIQCVSYGHSVSTWGSRADYWIGGRDVEPEVHPEANYSERLVLLPGCGGPPVIPDYALTHPVRRRDRVVVNCPWGAYKLNSGLLADLLAIRDRARDAGIQLLFRFFLGAGCLRMNSYLVIKRDLGELFGQTEEFEVIVELPYQEYMAEMEKGHLMLDSYPFGGCNSIMDALWLRQPVVTRFGSEWNNRYGMALLRRFGLGHLAVSTSEEYRSLSFRLIADAEFRNLTTEKIASLDLVHGSYDEAEAVSFRRAIDYLIDNHEALSRSGERTPILID